MAQDLRQALWNRVAVLHGAGGHFCAGADLAAVGDPDLQHELDPGGGGSGPMGPSRMALSKPLIAAFNGYAVAGGLELALLANHPSAHAQWSLPLDAAEGADGAARFAQGAGRHGRFDSPE